MNKISNQNSKRNNRLVGKCIYCGDTNELSKEHIVPKGLFGEHTLSEASCKKCRNITSSFEKYVLRNMYLSTRATLNAPTKHPENRPDKFPLTVEKDGVKEEIFISTNSYPVIVPVVYFRKPRHVGNYEYRKGISVIGTSIAMNSKIYELKKKYGFDSVFMSFEYKNEFARLLAKIAYGMTVLQYGLENIEEVYVLPSILGVSGDIGYWVGCAEDNPVHKKLPRENLWYRVNIGTTRANEIRAKIRLLPKYSNTPEYLVIVGRLKDTADK